MPRCCDGASSAVWRTHTHRGSGTPTTRARSQPPSARPSTTPSPTESPRSTSPRPCTAAAPTTTMTSRRTCGWCMRGCLAQSTSSCTRLQRPATALLGCMSTRRGSTGSQSWSSTRRIACTARRATSKTPHKTSGGPCLKAGVGRPTRSCNNNEGSSIVGYRDCHVFCRYTRNVQMSKRDARKHCKHSHMTNVASQSAPTWPRVAQHRGHGRRVIKRNLILDPLRTHLLLRSAHCCRRRCCSG